MVLVVAKSLANSGHVGETKVGFQLIQRFIFVCLETEIRYRVTRYYNGKKESIQT